MSMSYSIHYGPERPKHARKKKNRYGMAGAVIVLLVCAAAAGWSMPEQAQQFYQALFPWTRQEVKEAFSELKTDLRQGETVSDAVTSFCLEILDDAEKSQ